MDIRFLIWTKIEKIDSTCIIFINVKEFHKNMI